MKYPETMHPTSTALHVVDPAYISIVALPGKNPALISGEEYDIVTEIYSANDQLIFPGDGVRVEVTIPQYHLQVRIALPLYTATIDLDSLSTHFEFHSRL
jgi:hypothetical protein